MTSCSFMERTHRPASVRFAANIALSQVTNIVGLAIPLGQAHFFIRYCNGRSFYEHLTGLATTPIASFCTTFLYSKCLFLNAIDVASDTWSNFFDVLEERALLISKTCCFLQGILQFLLQL